MTLDLRNQYLFQRDLPVLEEDLKTLLVRIPVKKVGGNLIGVSSCVNLLSHIHINHMAFLLNTLSSTGHKVYFPIPFLAQSRRFTSANLWDYLKECIESKYFGCLVINDIDTESFSRIIFKFR